MASAEKFLQLQIRVSKGEKALIRRAAAAAGLSMSAYALSRLLPPQKTTLQEYVQQLTNAKEAAYVLAAIHDLFCHSTAAAFEALIADVSLAPLTPYLQNYLAAMIEQAAAHKRVQVPTWMHAIVPLDGPVFGSDLKSLQLYLLTHSPIPFRRRNIFIDATIGDRV